MYQDEYYIIKESGTYSNVLEALGLGTILNFILKDGSNSIKIIDTKTHYVIKLSETLTEEIINNTKYFEFIRFIKNKKNRHQKVLKLLIMKD